MSVDLCERVDLVPMPAIRDGCSVIEFRSAHPTQVTPDGSAADLGGCHYMCAELVFDPAVGALRVAFTASALLCVSGFDVAPEGSPHPGVLMSPAIGALSGTVVVYYSTTPCIPDRAFQCATARPDWPPGLPEPLDPKCFDGEWECTFCGNDDDSPCSIEETTYPICPPDGVPAGPGPLMCPGFRIIPDADSFDVFGRNEEFYAGGGLRGYVTLYLGTFSGRVDPRWPDSTFCGWGDHWCCKWLCGWKFHYVTEQAWEIHCIDPVVLEGSDPPIDDGSTRPFSIAPRRNRIGVVTMTANHFEDSCFDVVDQYCMTGGISVYPTDDPWAHLRYDSPQLHALDRLDFDLNCRIATDPERYPHSEPEYARIMNDALATAGGEMPNVLYNYITHSPLHWYNGYSLNRWQRGITSFTAPGEDPCLDAPRVRRADGTPWTVYMKPYGTDCLFPADLVLDSYAIDMRLSGEKGGWGPGLDTHLYDMKTLVTFEFWLFLKARLRDGWEEVDCPVAFAGSDACHLLTQPARPIVVGSDGCSRVPLQVYWFGMVGPRPWARRGEEYHTVPCPNLLPCCDLLWAIDGLLIPGAVNDTSDPDSPQRFEGDVVIMLQQEPAEYGGCGC